MGKILFLLPSNRLFIPIYFGVLLLAAIEIFAAGKELLVEGGEIQRAAGEQAEPELHAGGIDAALQVVRVGSADLASQELWAAGEPRGYLLGRPAVLQVPKPEIDASRVGSARKQVLVDGDQELPDERMMRQEFAGAGD